MNNYQTKRIGDKILEVFNFNVENKLFTILGWAFKKETNDSRESASIYLAYQLLSEGAKINIYDPMVNKSRILEDIKSLLRARNINGDKIESLLLNVNIFNDPYLAIENSNLVTICTEWDEFIKLNWSQLLKIMKNPSWVFDARNILDKNNLEQIGFKTFFIGRS